MSTLNLNIVEGFYNKGYFEDEASDGLWEYTDSKFVASKKRINADQSGLELILLTPLTDLQVVQQSFISRRALVFIIGSRSEEHTSELQSRGHLVCRLLLEKQKNNSSSSLCKSY